MELKHRKLLWNGNEFVFTDAPTVGVAGIAPNAPDELAEIMVFRWNIASRHEWELRDYVKTVEGLNAKVFEQQKALKAVTEG